MRQVKYTGKNLCKAGKPLVWTKNGDVTKMSNPYKKYGIGIATYNRMFEKQNGCCAICGIHQSDLKKCLHIDHCHETKMVRGLLCSKCNHLLGCANDNIDILFQSIIYLRLSRGERVDDVQNLI